MTQQFASLRDYQCDFINTKYKNGRALPESNRYYFKKPHLIRLEVTSGKDKGSVCVYNSQGKVRAHAGGILGIFTITMEPNDKRLQDDDGSTFIETDLGHTISDIQKTIAEGKATVAEVERGGAHYYQLEIDRSGKHDLILIDTQVKLPIEWSTFRNGQPDSKTEWKDLRVNAGVSDALFNL
jgi:outer membrane lipoprotein-sorting protein